MPKVTLSEVVYRTLLTDLGKTWGQIQDNFEKAFVGSDILIKAKIRTLIASHVAIEVLVKNENVRVSDYHEPLSPGDLYINPFTKRLKMVEW